MKTIFLYIITIALALNVASCDKGEDIVPDVDNGVVDSVTVHLIKDFNDCNEIIGVWRSDVSLIDGKEQKLANDILISFNNDNTFTFSCNDVLTKGTYHYKDSVAYCTKNEQIIIKDGLQFKFSNYNKGRVRIDISENVLLATYKSSIIAVKD